MPNASPGTRAHCAFTAHAGQKAESLCSNACINNICGDGIVNHGEECDDANADDGGDACSNGCIINFCGDGTINNGEQCDDANAVDDGACSNTCTFNADNADPQCFAPYTTFNRADWTSPVQVVSCGDFYLYNLQEPGPCDLRVCGEDVLRAQA